MLFCRLVEMVSHCKLVRHLQSKGQVDDRKSDHLLPDYAVML